MLLISNGAYKNGSTWLFMILKMGMSVRDIPVHFQVGEAWNNETIQEDRLEEFLKTIDYRNYHYVIKSHWMKPETRSLLMTHDHTYVFNIRRDLRDALVSAYYYEIHQSGKNITFMDYFQVRGNNLLDYLLNHHRLWSPVPGKIFVASYENLIHDFKTEAQRIYAFIGIRQPDHMMDQIIKKTSIQSLRVNWHEESKEENQRFFRKGQIGEWKTHFTPSIESAYWKMIDHYKANMEENSIK